MSTAFKPEVATDGVVKIPSSVFKSLPPPAAKKEGVIGVVKRLDGTVEELGAMSYVKSNPNFQPRQTQWSNNVTVINKDEALIKLHLRKGIPLPPELQVSGCSTPTSCLPFAHAPRHPIAPAELQASGCLLTPHASRRTPCASRLAWHCKSHAARRTPHAAPQVSRLAPHATAHDCTGEEGEARSCRCREQVGRLQPIRRRQGVAAGQVFRGDQAGRPIRAACGEGLRDDQAGRRLQPACGQGHRRGPRGRRARRRRSGGRVGGRG